VNQFDNYSFPRRGSNYADAKKEEDEWEYDYKKSPNPQRS
jgi:hypothetical protein